MMFPKSKPLRSPGLMKFAHENMKPAPCCVCEERPWVQAHHFGDDGGKALKPSDNEVARTCLRCHNKYDFKRRALIKKQSAEYLDVLERYQNDALKINRAYIDHLEAAKNKSLPAARCSACGMCSGEGECRAQLPHVEPPNDCALDELNLWLITEGPGLGPDEQRNWLLRWANRRSANVIDFLVEPMREIAAHPLESLGCIAARALKTACLEEVEEDGENNL